MPKKYPDLKALVTEDKEAYNYFISLPDYVREQISQRSSHINSFESLKDYAENLLRGDD
ncbi:MAG: hypothetical protein GX196_02965 [Clostridiaceae bacterium]|nr:hypothetical protein [Clostridiaceae bacterium]